MVIAFGMTRSKCADKPEYKTRHPSSWTTSWNVWTKLRYLGTPDGGNGCRNRVRTTSCGYVMMVATNFAAPAARLTFHSEPSVGVPSGPARAIRLNCSYSVHWIVPSVTPSKLALKPR